MDRRPARTGWHESRTSRYSDAASRISSRLGCGQANGLKTQSQTSRRRRGSLRRQALTDGAVASPVSVRPPRTRLSHSQPEQARPSSHAGWIPLTKRQPSADAAVMRARPGQAAFHAATCPSLFAPRTLLCAASVHKLWWGISETSRCRGHQPRREEAAPAPHLPPSRHLEHRVRLIRTYETASVCRNFPSGRSRTRTWDLFLIREAL